MAAALLCPGGGLPWCLRALSPVCLLINGTLLLGIAVSWGCVLPCAGGAGLLDSAFLKTCTDLKSVPQNCAGVWQ